MSEGSNEQPKPDDAPSEPSIDETVETTVAEQVSFVGQAIISRDIYDADHN